MENGASGPKSESSRVVAKRDRCTNVCTSAESCRLERLMKQHDKVTAQELNMKMLLFEGDDGGNGGGGGGGHVRNTRAEVPRRHPSRKTWHPEDAHATADELGSSGKVRSEQNRII